MKPRKWVLCKTYIKTARGKEAIIVCSGPMPDEHERIEVTETGDASHGIQDELDDYKPSIRKAEGK
jgi:hypothetical protein